MQPIIDQKYLLSKMPGKGGWTYAVIEEIPQDRKSKFGWVQVSGFIDNYELKNYKLMPMGNGKLFLPLKAEIRKKIKKEAGDWVHVVLQIDDSTAVFPEEIIDCIKDESEAYKIFVSYSEIEQKAFIDWILAAQIDEEKVTRIVKTINKLLRKEKM